MYLTILEYSMYSDSTDIIIIQNACAQFMDGKITYFKKTEKGELFHKLLKNGDIMKSLLRVSGKRLRRYT
jgi:hypothetical protein